MKKKKILLSKNEIKLNKITNSTSNKIKIIQIIKNCNEKWKREEYLFSMPHSKAKFFSFSL